MRPEMVYPTRLNRWLRALEAYFYIMQLSRNVSRDTPKRVSLSGIHEILWRGSGCRRLVYILRFHFSLAYFSLTKVAAVSISCSVAGPRIRRP